MATQAPGSAAAGGQSNPAWPQFAVVNRSTLPEEIAARLLDLIRAEQLRPGDKLPAERDLASMMHVSRPVLREALRALAIMKVVEIRQGAGTYITALEPQQLVSHLDFVLSKDPVALAQVIETRRVVEVGNVRLAAVRIDDAGLARLDGLLDELKQTVGDPDRFSTLDIVFHDTVCEAAGNFLLAQFMRIIDTLGKVSRERTGASRTTRERALADHVAIVAALRAHDPGAAALAMEGHLEHVEAALARAAATGRAPGAASGRSGAAAAASGRSGAAARGRSSAPRAGSQR